MSADPYSFIANLIVGAAARNMKESGSGASSSEKGGYSGQQQGMRYEQAPSMGNTAQSPTAQLSQFATGVTPGQQKQIPVVGQALQGEEQMLRNVTPARGAYFQQPVEYHSNTPWANPYLQYLRY